MDNEHSLLIIHWIPLIPSKSCNDQVWACRSHRRKRKGIPEDPLGEFEWNLPWYGCDGVYFKWMEAATSTRNEVNFISDTGLFLQLPRWFIYIGFALRKILSTVMVLGCFRTLTNGGFPISMLVFRKFSLISVPNSLVKSRASWTCFQVGE